MSAQTQQAVDLLRSIATGERAPSAIINAEHYTQHNLTAPDGLAGFLGLQKLVSTGGIARAAAFLGIKPTVDTLRGFQDREYVFTHTKFWLYGQNMVSFEVFRFENGKSSSTGTTFSGQPLRTRAVTR